MRVRYRLFVLASLAISLVAAGCAGDDPTDATPDVLLSDDGRRAETTAPSSADYQAFPDPVRQNVEWVDTRFAGTRITYALAVPPGDAAEPRPVLLAFPPGGQDRRLVEIGLDGYWLDAAMDAGWIVVSPVAPDGVLFFQGSESLVPDMLAQVTARFPAEDGVVHVAGISNGGISAFRFAAENPDQVASITVLPGFPNDSGDLAALDTLDVPIRMWAGETDTRWVEEMLAVEARLSSLGGDVVATVVPGAGHVIGGGEAFTAEIWTELESARQ